MTTESFPIRAESLLQHREFVRALARSLVRDEHAAQDVVQETWLEALRHPPRAAAALPGWLARVVRSRAQNVARGEGRRVARERSVAREEVDESEEKLRERVAMQHKVVEAVLALKEPYKTVVLLHYYEGLPPSQIAARRNMPAGSVRAQLSRAHDLLRERLDAEFGGSRAAWSVALLGLSRSAPTSAAAAKIALVAGIVFVAVAVPIAWKLVEPKPSAPVLSGALDNVAVDATAAAPASSAASDASSEPVSHAREPVAVAATIEQSKSVPADLAALSIPDAILLAKQVQQALREKLLVPDKSVPEVRAALSRHPDLALARILPYGRLEGDIDGRFLGLRGAGADFSFFSNSNDYDRQPDIHLDRELSARHHVAAAGVLIDVGERELEEFTVPGKRAPSLGGSRDRETWDLLWSDAHTGAREFDHGFVERAKALNLGDQAPAGVGHVYLVRCILPGEHDVLAAFQILAGDDYGYTFAWSVLHSWPIPEGAAAQRGPGDGERIDRLRGYSPAPPPDWMAQLDVPGLMELSHRIRSALEPKLFPKRPDLEQKYASILASPDAGVARMLNRGAFDAIVDGRERGAYYSFATRSNDFDREQDLCLEQNHFSSASTRGFLMELGSVGIEDVLAWGPAGPSSMAEGRRTNWNLLWSLRHAENYLSSDHLGRALDEEGERLVREAGLESYAPATLNHTCLLRSIQPEKHDLLVAFTVVDTDDCGLWIVWRKLRSW